MVRSDLGVVVRLQWFPNKAHSWFSDYDSNHPSHNLSTCAVITKQKILLR